MTKIQIPHDAIVFVGDGRKALFMRNEGDEKFPNLKTERVFTDVNPPTHEQGTDKPGALRCCNRVQAVGAGSRFAQGGSGDGNQISQMFARGQFRHDAAVFGVQLDLRGNDIGQHPAVAHNRGAGFVARGFKGKDGHWLNG